MGVPRVNNEALVPTLKRERPTDAPEQRHRKQIRRQPEFDEPKVASSSLLVAGTLLRPGCIAARGGRSPPAARHGWTSAQAQALAQIGAMRNKSLEKLQQEGQVRFLLTGATRKKVVHFIAHVRRSPVPPTRSPPHARS